MQKSSLAMALVTVAVFAGSISVADARPRPRGGWDGNGPDKSGAVQGTVIVQGGIAQLPSNRRQSSKKSGGGWDHNGPSLTGTRR